MLYIVGFQANLATQQMGKTDKCRKLTHVWLSHEVQVFSPTLSRKSRITHAQEQMCLLVLYFPLVCLCCVATCSSKEMTLKSPQIINSLSGPVLRNTARLSQRYPPIARYGVFGVSTWPIGCDTPSPFSERFPLWEQAKWRCDTPPLRKGISAILARYPMKPRQMGAIPPSTILSRKDIARYGGLSRTGPLSQFANQPSFVKIYFRSSKQELESCTNLSKQQKLQNKQRQNLDQTSNL